jgi:hypothetical protein
MKATMDIIVGDSKINEYMHSLDVFEKGKYVASLHQIVVSGENLPLDFLVDHIKNAYEKVGSASVVFVSICSADGVFTANYSPFIKPNVQTISNGTQYGRFKDQISGIGYEVETDEFMHVLSAKLKL